MAEIRARGIIIKQSDYGEGPSATVLKNQRAKLPHQVNFCVTVILIFTKVSEKI